VGGGGGRPRPEFANRLGADSGAWGLQGSMAESREERAFLPLTIIHRRGSERKSFEEWRDHKLEGLYISPFISEILAAVAKQTKGEGSGEGTDYSERIELSFSLLPRFLNVVG